MSTENRLRGVKAFARYTLLRLGVLAVVAALLWLVGLRGLPLLFVAFLLSGLISFFALRSDRDRASIALDRRLSTIKERLAERERAEDEWNEARIRSEQSDSAER